MALPQRPKYYSSVAPSATQRDMDNFIDEQRNADMLDALADIAHEQEQAMRESEQSEWDGIVHEDLDDPSHWAATRASSYSRDDETAMAAFNYPSDSCEADRWR
jgi:hypothetical protein